MKEARIRHERVTHKVAEGVMLELYTRDDKGGRGPCASVSVFGEEFIRFDCFGDNEGHYHVYHVDVHAEKSYRSFRLNYPVASRVDHMMRSAVEVRLNLMAWLSTHGDVKVRDLVLTPVQLASMQTLMIDFGFKYMLVMKGE